MAPKASSALLFSLLLLLLIASAANGATSTLRSAEFNAMLQSLRNYGYTLFTNSIATSDLKYQLLASSASAVSNFTLFAPRDELLYALDMATDSAVYVSTLRYHIVPNRRHTFADLKNLSAPFLDTLLPNFAVLVGKVRDIDVSDDRASVGVVVDGVRLSFPDLFVGSRIVVHGIDGILLTGMNMSRDPDANDIGLDHIPPVGSPARGVDANLPPEIHAPTSQSGWNNVAPSPASAFDENIPADIHAPSDQFGWSYFAPAPASAFDESIPPEIHPPTDQFGWNYVAPSPAEGPLGPNSQFDSNYVPTPPASNEDVDIPWERTPTTPTSQFDRNHAQAPPAFNIPANGRSTTPASRFGRNHVPTAPVKGSSTTPASRIGRNHVPTAPAKESSTTPASQIGRNHIPTAPVKGSSTTPASQIGQNHVPTAPSKGSSTTPASRIDGNHAPSAPVQGGSTTPTSGISRNHVPSAPAAGTLNTPRSHSHWSNIPVATTPRITKDQIEKMKRYRRKHPGKVQQKGRRRRNHHRRGVGRSVICKLPCNRSWKVGPYCNNPDILGANMSFESLESRP